MACPSCFLQICELTNRVNYGTFCNMELRQGGVVADEESAPDEWTDLAQGDTRLIETGQFQWLVHGWSVVQCAASLKVSPRNLALSSRPVLI
jgi:hypothetical protein